MQPFPNQTANITLTGAGMAYAMAADGTVSGTVIQPPAGTLLPGLYRLLIYNGACVMGCSRW